MIKRENWEWFGSPGHLIVADSCRFHLCTRVGQYLVSTIGDYYLHGVLTTIGAGKDSFFETYVFKIVCPTKRCRCGCGIPDKINPEIDGRRCPTREKANKQHIEFCLKYGGM